jgi:hypothetical protein
MAWMVLGQYTFKIVSGDHDLHPRWLPWADIVLTYIVEPYWIWIVKLRCIRHADILKRAYLCQVIEMLDKLITYIVWWYKTVYHVLSVAWTNRITAGSHNRLDLIQSLVPPHYVCIMGIYLYNKDLFFLWIKSELFCNIGFTVKKGSL